MEEVFLLQIQGSFTESILPLMIVLIPIAGSIVLGLIGLKNALLRNILAIMITGFVLYLSIELFFIVAGGYTVYFELPTLAGIAMSLKIDLTGSVFALFSALIWFLATLASISYMKYEERQTRYFTFLILTLGGCLGVFLSGDFLSLFLFFELMTLAAYALVVHTQTREAMYAGGNYL